MCEHDPCSGLKNGVLAVLSDPWTRSRTFHAAQLIEFYYS